MKLRYYGHVGQITGYGRAAADYCRSLLATGKVELEIRPLGTIAPSGFDDLLPHIRTRDSELTEPDIIIVHTLPLDCRKVQDLVLARALSTEDPRVSDKPWVCITTWEGCSAIPTDVQKSLWVFDQVWVPSFMCQQTIAFDAYPDDRPDVILVPHAFDPATLEARRKSSGRPENDRYRFYWIGAWTSRKNPAGLIRAWASAFTREDHVELVIHSPGKRDELAVAVGHTGLGPNDLAPITHNNEFRSDPWIWDLHASSDCFVTATRGEAWNLPAFDAMLARRHIITPHFTGADEFLQPLGGTSAQGYDSIPAPAAVDVEVTERMANGLKMRTIGAQGLTSRCWWREPDLVSLALHMRTAYERRIRDLRLDYDPVERYGYEAVGKLALSALEDL